jgi:hypothetical protein
MSSGSQEFSSRDRLSPIFQVFERGGGHGVVFAKALNVSEVRQFITLKFNNPRIVRCICARHGSHGIGKSAVAIVEGMYVCADCMNHLRRPLRERVHIMENWVADIMGEIDSLWDVVNSQSGD